MYFHPSLFYSHTSPGIIIRICPRSEQLLHRISTCLGKFHPYNKLCLLKDSFFGVGESLCQKLVKFWFPLSQDHTERYRGNLHSVALEGLSFQVQFYLRDMCGSESFYQVKSQVFHLLTRGK